MQNTKCKMHQRVHKKGCECYQKPNRQQGKQLGFGFGFGFGALSSCIVAYINYTPTYINYLLINLSRRFLGGRKTGRKTGKPEKTYRKSKGGPSWVLHSWEIFSNVNQSVQLHHRPTDDDDDAFPALFRSALNPLKPPPSTLNPARPRPSFCTCISETQQ